MTDFSDHPLQTAGFDSFFEGWLVRHESLHERLLLRVNTESVDVEENQRSLIEQVVSHYHQYYEEKLKLAREDVFLVISAPWLSSFEQTLLWIGGFKPSMIHKIVERSVRDLSAEQCLRMERVKAESRRREKELSEIMARIQESIAAPTFIALALQTEMERLRNGEITGLQLAMEELKAAMVGLFESAEVLRRWMMRKLFEILTTSQKFKFLRAVVEFQLRVRRWGLQRDSHRLQGRTGQGPTV